jgi:GTP-binding protein
VAIAGVEGVEIGDTVVADPLTPSLPRIVVDPPTLRMTFMVNNSPFAGKEGKFVTSRQIRERLVKAGKQNVALRISEGATPDQFEVAGRGELQLAVLVESMRREGYELQLSRPDVVTRAAEAGGLEEPMEYVTIDVPESHIGVVTSKMSDRRAQMVTMHNPGSGRVRLEYRIPSRGLIGFRSEFLTDTRGTGVLNTLFDGWAPHLGPIPKRPNGGLVSDRLGRTTPYAIFNLQPRGIMFIGANTDVYEGMLVGMNNRENDLEVNICREKKLTNIRAAGKDENVILTPPKVMSLEQAIEFIDDDELVEVTPKSLRLRKKILSGNMRPKRTVREDEEES